MSGETENSVSAWTPDTVHVHVLDQLTYAEKLNASKFKEERDYNDARLKAERDYVDSRFTATRDHSDSNSTVIEQRLVDIDKATELLSATVNRVPTDVDKQVGHLRLLTEEKFESVAKQFRERDTRSERESRDNKVAVDAAFAAQKEAACLAANEPILCADLVWRMAGDLTVGDELIAFDEDGPNRHYRRSVVTAHALVQEELLEVTTPRGNVRCTYNHPWLVRKYDGRLWEWIEAIDLKPGYQAMHMIDVWEVERSWEAGWLAGMLDGEGCLTFKSSWNGRAKLGITQVSGLTADNITKALEELKITISHRTRTVGEKNQPRQDWEINRRPDIMKVLGSIRPERLLASADQVWEDFAIKGHERMTTITSIEPVGIGAIAQMSTSTHTYIGAGFAMHNSEQNKSNTLAISKSETATSETINKLSELFTTNNKALSDKIESNSKSAADKVDDLKERISQTDQRINSIEAAKQGAKDTGYGLYLVAALFLSFFGILITAGLYLATH